MDVGPTVVVEGPEKSRTAGSGSMEGGRAAWDAAEE